MVGRVKNIFVGGKLQSHRLERNIVAVNNFKPAHLAVNDSLNISDGEEN
jgi:hypothetical protein